MISKTITLSAPIELRSKDTNAVIHAVTELVMRPLTLGDLVAAMDAAGGGRDVGTMTLHLAARSCGVTPAQLAELSLEDGAKVLEAVSGFMPAGLRNGTAG